MREIDCCGRWSNCAKEGHCVATERAKGCAYARHLEHGFNFLNPDFKNRPYLVIENRLYYMGAKSSTHTCSYAITAEVAQNLKAHHLQFSPFCLDNAWPEISTDANPCSYRVVAEIGGAEYVILNANVRMLQQDTALQIRDHLRSAGHPSRLERIGIPAKAPKTASSPSDEAKKQHCLPANSTAAPSISVAPEKPKPQPPTHKPSRPTKAELAHPLPGQVSIFDL